MRKRICCVLCQMLDPSENEMTDFQTHDFVPTQTTGEYGAGKADSMDLFY